MARLLYVKASPRGDFSHSLAVADAFVQAYRQAHRRDEVVVRDVFADPLIPFDGLYVKAKYTVLHGASPTGAELEAWHEVEQVIQQFASADRYVVASPMWNFSIPYRLKQYLDVIVQPGYTFRVNEQGGYEGLMTGRRALLVLARGGEYPAGTPGAAYDMQKPYLELALGFMGITDVQSLVVEPTLMLGPDVAKQRTEAAVERARALARAF